MYWVVVKSNIKFPPINLHMKKQPLATNVGYSLTPRSMATALMQGPDPYPNSQAKPDPDAGSTLLCLEICHLFYNF